MAIFENVLLALSSIRSNKMRSLLTMLGIIIGIGAVIAIQTVGNSLTGSLSDSMSSFGANNINVSVTSKDGSSSDWRNGGSVRMFGPSNPTAADLITSEMIEEYRTTFGDKVRYIEITESVGTGKMTSRTDSSTTVSATLTGVNLDSRYTKKIDCIYGRFLNQQDIDGGKKVAVVSDRFILDALDCAPVNAIGKSFKLKVTGGGSDMMSGFFGGTSSTSSASSKILELFIVGVYEYEEENTSSLFFSSDDVVTDIYLPITTAKTLNGSSAGTKSFTVSPSNEVDVTSFLTVTGDFFASFYTRNESFTAEATSLSSMLETITEMLSTVSLAISAIAAIALLVGGIGVMNIMTVSVTERTREIGTRKALGAPASAIRTQFIIEAMVVCAIGGIIGVAVGIGFGAAAAKLLGYAAKPTISTILIAVGFSMGIGVFFGYYPANKAAKMNPIDALRYE